MISIADPDVSEAAIGDVRAVLESGMIADGPQVRAFEDEFAAFCDTDHAVAAANGTAALQTALVAAGIDAGDTVLTTPFSFVASANAARLRGTDVVFADIDPETFNLSPDAVAAVAADHDVDAIVAVHLYGLPADMDALRAVADEHDAILVEDAAQAHGAAYRGERVGSLGDVAAFSFYPTKNMTTAEGGMVTTDDEAIANRAERFVNHGRSAAGEHVEVGHNLRLTSVAAAIGRDQLERLAGFNERRRHNAARLTEGLADTGVETPTVPEDRRHVHHQYTVRTTDRNRLSAVLEENDVGSAVYYPRCIHEQPAYDPVPGPYPEAERAAREVLSLPVHPNVTDADVDHVIEVIQDYAN